MLCWGLFINTARGTDGGLALIPRSTFPRYVGLRQHGSVVFFFFFQWVCLPAPRSLKWTCFQSPERPRRDNASRFNKGTSGCLGDKKRCSSCTLRGLPSNTSLRWFPAGNRLFGQWYTLASQRHKTLPDYAPAVSKMQPCCDESIRCIICRVNFPCSVSCFPCCC